MERCDLSSKCRFLNKTMITRPLTTGHMKENYRNADFHSCTIYKVAKSHGIDKVPRYIAPCDKYELLTWLPKAAFDVGLL